jgi:quercetin dioxygenase-like cupin family protein
MKFETVEEKVLEHFKGGEGALKTRMIVDETVRFMRGKLEPGSSIGMHEHSDSCEVLYVISGVGTAIMDGVEETVCAGEYHYCPKGHAHTLINRGVEDLIFFAVIPQQ